MAAKNIQSGHFLSFDKSVNKGNTSSVYRTAGGIIKKALRWLSQQSKMALTVMN